MIEGRTFKITSHRNRKGISRNLLLGIVGGLVLASFSVLGLMIFSSNPPDASQQLEIGLRLLRKGDGDSSAKIAASIPKASLTKRSDVSKREFLLGIHERKEAELTDQRRVALEHNETAVKHLKKSRELSFPDGYEGLGNYNLGIALFDLLRWDEAEPILEIAADRWPQGRVDSIERLVDIDLSFDNHDAESALARIHQWRSLPRSTSNEEDRATAKEMQALYVRGDYEDVLKIAESINLESPKRPIAELICGRCLQQIAKKLSEPDRTEKLKAATINFRNVMDFASAPPKTRRQSNLELGRTTRELGELTQAVSLLSMLRLSSPYEVEGLAGGLEEIVCLIDLNRNSDAVATLEHVTQNFGELRWYENDWMTFAEMRKMIVESANRMIDKEAYAEAARFVVAMPPMCEEPDRLRLSSRLYDRWAQALRNKGDTEGKIETYARISAEAFAKLATKQLRAPEYSDLLMKSIENYRLAGAFKESNQQLEKFLQFEPRENLPLGLLTKARNFRSLDQFDKALATLNQIFESNTSTSLIHDARLEAAKMLASKDDFTGAEELIVQNLYYSDLKPESVVWRESLFELGELLFRKGEKLQAQATKAILETPSQTAEHVAAVEQSYKELIRGISRIEEGLRRFDSDPRRTRMLYTTAKAYQLAATWPALLLQQNRIANEETIAAWKSQRKELLTQARNTFHRLKQEITESPNAATDSANSKNSENFLRNSYFGEADLLFEAGEYEEAMINYRDTANRFINEPESIEAMIQIAICQSRLGKPVDSRRTLEMAKDVLFRIPPEKDSKFKAVTSHDRPGWETYIDWLTIDLQGK